jgi:two-component system OmpR family sensor kinase
MSNDRAIDVTETEPPISDAPWHEHGELSDPAANAGPLPPVSEEPPAAEQPTPARPRRWRFVPRSLSSRLVVFVVGLVLVVVTAAGAATYFALRSFLYDRLDQQLTSLAAANQDSIRTCFPAPECTIGGSGTEGVHSPQRQWLAVFGPTGQSVARVDPSPELSPLQLSQAQARALVSNPGQVHTYTTGDGSTLRVTARRLGAFTVVTGLSTTDVERTLHRLVWLEVAIGALAVAAALGLTTWGVHLSLRPLNRVTRTAREVTAELSPDGAGLDRRVPEGDPQTEVGQLAESFNSLMGTVEAQFAARVESEERMRQFLADASHELRTPLTSIRGYAELSRMRRANGEAEHADTLDRIESEGTRMSRLVDDLLLLARGDRGARPQVEVVDVAELIEDAVDSARAAFPERHIDIVASPGVTLLADRDQLLRVLRNLITNAAVHTDPNAPIQVIGEGTSEQVMLRVVDSGPGLPPEQAQHVFERFWRADKARSRARGGSGLGLAIVAQLVQAHHGTVEFESSTADGTTVTVRLPRDGTAPDS